MVCNIINYKYEMSICGKYYRYCLCVYLIAHLSIHCIFPIGNFAQAAQQSCYNRKITFCINLGYNNHTCNRKR